MAILALPLMALIFIKGKGSDPSPSA